jgi:DNA-binding NtrC family response regulator
MVGESPPMRALFGILARIARHDAAVLITGPSGTGKELAARAVHDHGPRQDGPFVAVNCAAITDSLFESELFGHEKGAFTGAIQRQNGAFQNADGGTLFLDEVGELKLEAQAKLLRALESGEVRRVGAQRPEFPDVRVIAATNRDLAEMVHRGTFREDLYFRLAVLTVRMPALHERLSDLPLIAKTLLQRLYPEASITPEALGRLRQHPWPGNVRELRNVLTRAYVLGGATIGCDHIAFDALAFRDESTDRPPQRGFKLEREVVLRTLERHGGNRSNAARELGIPRSTLNYKLRQWEDEGSPRVDDENAK